MSIGEVDEKNFDELPILLIINIFNKINFNFLDFIDTLRKFKQNEQAKICDYIEIRGNIN